MSLEYLDEGMMLVIEISYYKKMDLGWAIEKGYPILCKIRYGHNYYDINWAFINEYCKEHPSKDMVCYYFWLLNNTKYPTHNVEYARELRERILLAYPDIKMINL
jgi:hypothetical protein